MVPKAVFSYGTQEEAVTKTREVARQLSGRWIPVEGFVNMLGKQKTLELGNKQFPRIKRQSNLANYQEWTISRT